MTSWGPQLTGVRRVSTGSAPTYAKVGHGPHDVTYRFKPIPGKIYVLTLGSQFADHLVTLNQNGQTVTLPDSFNDTITVNVTPRNPKAEQVLRFRLNKKDAWFENFDLYQADATQVIHDLKKLQTLQPKSQYPHVFDRSQLIGRYNQKRRYTGFLNALIHACLQHFLSMPNATIAEP